MTDTEYGINEISDPKPWYYSQEERRPIRPKIKAPPIDYVPPFIPVKGTAILTGGITVTAGLLAFHHFRYCRYGKALRYFIVATGSGFIAGFLIYALLSDH